MKAPTSFLPVAAVLALLLLLPSTPAALAAKSPRPGMGAVPYADADGTGTTFRVWAGAAKKVEVSGEFNGWLRTELASEGNGIWSVDVPGAGHGQKYKFILDGNWRKDPRAVQVESSARDANCYIYDHSLFDWEGAEHVIGGTDGRDCIYRNDLVIYEMHVGSFNGESYLPATFDSAIDKIPYLKKLGVSAVEVMPVAEFAGDRSWGYNPSDLFAPESSLGGADGLKRFVKACHQAGIAVIVDVVHNHYGPDDLAIWQFDGNGPNGGMYFYDDDRRYTDWGETRPDYGDTNVVAFIRDQIFSLVEDYHVDGFRWDSVFNIAYVGGSWNQEGADLLTAINNELYEKHPDVFRIAEDNALTTWEESWMGFEAQWHPGFLTDIRALATASDDAWRSMPTLAGRLSLYGGFYQVLYAESHDSCGNLNGKHRLPRDIDSRLPQGYWAKKRAFLANAVALVAPGIPMLFMGTEYNEDWDFSNDHSLRWSALAEENAGIVQMYSDLIALRRNAKGVTDALRDAYNAQCTVCNDDGKVVAVARGDGLLLVFNWSATAYQPYETVGFPASGTWHCLYNSDSSAYDPSFGNVGPAVGDTVSVGDSHIAAVPLGAYSLQIWGTTPLPVDATAAFDPPVPEGCSSVAISFDPGDGALASSDSVSARIGLNTWDESAIRTVPMSRAGGGTLWTCTFDIPDDTSELLVCFHDATATVWENNNGENWHCAIDGCGGMPSAVSADPARPTDGSTFTLRYEVNAGPLTNRAAGSSIVAHVGCNGWNDVRDIPMTNVSGDLWECPVEIPLGTWSLTVCFHDGGDVWDNHDGNNWRIAVSIEDATPVPSFAITSPSTSPVTLSDATVTVRGTSTNFAGPLLWTNASNGGAATLLPGATWTADIPLAYGTNILHFIALNPNDGAADSDYTDFRTGANGGHGFAPWTLDIPSANAGVFTDATDGWGFWANSGAMVEARRPFVYPLQPGDTVTFGFRNGDVDTDDPGPRGSVGFGFCNAHGQTALEWYFNGGADDYVLNAAVRTNAMPFTYDRQPVAFTLGSNWTYTLAVGTHTWTGNLKNTSVDRIAYVRFWNYTAGHGDARNLYVSDLAVNGSNPYLSPELSQDLTVIRPGAPAPVITTATSATVSTDPGTGLPVLTATLSADAPSALADSVWYAVTLDPATRSWNWTNIPPSAVTLSGPTVTIRCPDLHSAIYSLGTPGSP